MPEIIAHRGGALLWPENSLLACRGAVALGVDQVQIDVQLAADGHVVVLHDSTLDRTTEGRGPVHVRPWSELSLVRLRDAPGETIPSLAAVAALLSGTKARLRLELKHPANDAVRSNLTACVVDVLQRAGLIDRAVITSFCLTDLERAHALAPGVPLAWLLDAPATSAWSDASAESARLVGCATIGVRHDRLTQVLRRSRVAAGLRLCCFGAHDTAALQASFAAGAEEVSTDRPDLGLHLRFGVSVS